MRYLVRGILTFLLLSAGKLHAQPNTTLAGTENVLVYPSIAVAVNEAVVIPLSKRATKVAVTQPEIAQVEVVSPDTVLIHGRAVRATSPERTLSIIKPDAVARGLIGDILKRFEAAGLKIVAAKLVRLSLAQAEAFYAVHKERPFFPSLTAYMSSGPIFVAVLEGEAAIAKNRQIMGATDPAKAAAGTIRRDWGKDVEQNAVHGSDGPETAATEIAFFFKPDEIIRSSSQ